MMIFVDYCHLPGVNAFAGIGHGISSELVLVLQPFASVERGTCCLLLERNRGDADSGVAHSDSSVN